MSAPDVSHRRRQAFGSFAARQFTGPLRGGSRHAIPVVDTHTAGEPTRIVLGGIPRLRGNTISAKREYFKEKYDYLRRAIMWEPRGHRDMFGAILVKQSMPDAHLGVIFTDAHGYCDMCGHGTMGVATAALELGILPATDPLEPYFLETPAGMVSFRVKRRGRRVEEVTIQNVPAFLWKGDVVLRAPDVGEVKADLAFGGNWFALVAASALNVDFDRTPFGRMIHLGMALLDDVSRIRIDPVIASQDQHITHIEIYDDTLRAGESREKYHRNIVIWGHGQFDRSPCGTGTCARMAVLHAKGRLQLNEEFLSKSVIGTVFRGRLLRETHVGTWPAVVPEVTGNAWITAFNRLILDARDPLATGFLAELADSFKEGGPLLMS